MTKECQECGKSFDRSKTRRYKYCSAECAKKGQVRHNLEHQKTSAYKQYRKRYYQRTSKEHIARLNKWKSENKERYDEYQRQYYLDNRQKIIDGTREWRTKNRERYNEWQRKYQKRNRAKVEIHPARKKDVK